MNNKKKLMTLAGVSSLMLLLGACGRPNPAAMVNHPPTGFFYGSIYKYLGLPMQHLLDWFAGFLGGGSGYGIAILALTIVVRLILMPSMIKQQKGMAEQQEKAKVLQPQLKLLQAAAKKAQDQREQMQINGLMQDVYKKNGSSMMPKMGCLVLLIQLPIFSGLYSAVAYSKDIFTSTFFGIQLGKPSMIITIVATLCYFAQGWMSLQSATPEQRKSMQTMVMFSPLMTFWISMISSAGLGLYFLGTGLIMIVQQAIITFIITPSIRKRIDAEMADKPPVIVVSPDMFDEDGAINDRAPMPSSFAQLAGMGLTGDEGDNTARPERKDVTATSTEDDLRHRNAGKQKRRD